MSELSALRTARGTRGVKNTGVIIWIDGRHRQLCGAGNSIGPLCGRNGWRCVAHCHDAQIGVVVRNLRENGEPLVIGDQQTGLGVIERVGHLIRYPPGIHTHYCAADGNHAPIGKDPLRVVAQCNGDTITGPNILRLQPGSEIRHDLTCLGKGPTLVTINDVFLVAVALSQHP